MVKITEEGNLMKEGFTLAHSSRFQAIMVGKS